MTETTITKLSERGTVTLPKSLLSDLPAGTRFLVRRQAHDIILSVCPPATEPAASFVLAPEAFDFVNRLTAETYDDYLLQVALTDASAPLQTGS